MFISHRKFWAPPSPSHKPMMAQSSSVCNEPDHVQSEEEGGGEMKPGGRALISLKKAAPRPNWEGLYECFQIKYD